MVGAALLAAVVIMARSKVLRLVEAHKGKRIDCQQPQTESEAARPSPPPSRQREE